MNVSVLYDFASCVARLAQMVDPNSPAWHKANSDAEAVEFLAEYYTWEYIHLDGMSHFIAFQPTESHAHAI